jgi:hypothetical protein
MKCPNCQFENREEAKFCSKCGHNFEVTCQECEARNRSENNFCDECGCNLQPDLELIDKVSKVESQSFPPSSEKTSSEVSPQIFDQISKIINKYSGFIEKYAGDGVMALFGAEKAHEDDPIRAIKAAREIHSLVNLTTAEVGKPKRKPRSIKDL